MTRAWALLSFVASLLLSACGDQEIESSAGDKCMPGFEGDGPVCVDVDECERGTDDCGVNAACTNTGKGGPGSPYTVRGGKLLLVHEGGYSEAHVPFCGHAVIQALSAP